MFVLGDFWNRKLAFVKAPEPEKTYGLERPEKMVFNKALVSEMLGFVETT
jgi:hypothetical protein